MESARRRPVLLAIGLGLVPALVVGLGMLTQLGMTRFMDLLRRGRWPWSAVLGPLVTSGALLTVFTWLTATLPESPMFRRRKMRHKRVLTAVGCLLLSGTLWAGIILGDVGWRAALDDVGPSPTLDTPGWGFLLLLVLSAALLYGLLRPGRYPKKQ